MRAWPDEAPTHKAKEKEKDKEDDKVGAVSRPGIAAQSEIHREVGLLEPVGLFKGQNRLGMLGLRVPKQFLSVSLELNARMARTPRTGRTGKTGNRAGGTAGAARAAATAAEAGSHPAARGGASKVAGVMSSYPF